ncbi:ATP11 protein-domain-containing protein [Calycina marina]|uniref:ATP11 protein-domain-containing protein n=1 Tax=Calycina marina TaxID=1763456 RepID=A0A9P8CB73_9HELO|nr:ATP11 protein-domain-containing protein [Calycina marina]
MPSILVQTLRHVVAGPTPYLRATQRRWAQVHDVCSLRLLTTQPGDKFLQKYKDKLARKAKEEGLRDINELKEVYKDKIKTLKKKATIQIPIATTPPTMQPIKFSSSSLSLSKSPFLLPPPPPTISTEKKSSSAGIKTLSSYLNLEKTRALPQKELEAIWRLRHVNDAQSLCASVPVDTYKTMETTAKQFPNFILPLPKPGEQADEIHFLQWTFPAPDTVAVLFTHLAEYKLRGEYSEPHTIITHHLELAEEKGLILLQGQVIQGKGVSVDEAKWLLMCLQKFYGVSDESTKRRQLLEMFGKGDTKFKVEELVEESEKIV